jgi:tetratricopeptide (TPR) repeat protein
MSLVVVVTLALAATEPGPVVTGAAGDLPVFTRDEPHLAAGRRALLADEVDTAIERFRRAAAGTDTERAVVEYDVGQALTMRALAEARAAKAAAAAAPPSGPPAPEGAPTPPDVDDALAAFERAATLARDPRLVSEARLAAGNAALVGGKLDDAIAALRKALVAAPQNERARRNLQRALALKQQQPPPPPPQGGEDQQKQDGDEQQKQDGEQQKQDGGEQQKQDGEQQKQDGEQQKQDGGEQQKQDGDEQQKQDGDEQQKQDGEQQKQDGEQQKQGEQKPTPQPVKPKPTSKEEARRLLQGLRSRERPLSPLEMRGVEKRVPAPAGKEW